MYQCIGYKILKVVYFTLEVKMKCIAEQELKAVCLLKQ